jgi:hypothetical protein
VTQVPQKVSFLFFLWSNLNRFLEATQTTQQKPCSVPSTNFYANRLTNPKGWTQVPYEGYSLWTRTHTILRESAMENHFFMKGSALTQAQKSQRVNSSRGLSSLKSCGHLAILNGQSLICMINFDWQMFVLLRKKLREQKDVVLQDCSRCCHLVVTLCKWGDSKSCRQSFQENKFKCVCKKYKVLRPYTQNSEVYSISWRFKTKMH